MLIQEFNKKFHATTVKRIETEKLWGAIKVGSIIELKIRKKVKGKVSGHKSEEVIVKYKVLNKHHRNILLQKVVNGFKETFTFSDFMTDDVTI